MDDQKPNPAIDKLRRELQRKSLDQFLVFNPTEKDYVVVWDGFNHVIPANAERTLPRYIARKYFKEMTDSIIYQEESEKVDAANSKRLERGNPPLSPQERESYALQYGLHTANEPKRKEILKTLFKGIAEEYGVDAPAIGAAPKKKDERTADDRLLEEMEAATPRITGVSPAAKIQELPPATDKVTVQAKKVELQEKTKGKNDKKTTAKAT